MEVKILERMKLSRSGDKTKNLIMKQNDLIQKLLW